MNKTIKTLIPVVIIVSSLTVAVLINTKKINTPLMFGSIEKKLKSIITPKPPIGELTPTRDLRGVWKSSLVGKGIQVYGKFTTGPGVTNVYEDGDMELIIDSVENNIASGKMRFTNLCVTAEVVVPNIKTITTKKCVPDTGYSPVAIRVSASSLDFGTVAVTGATATMQGTYTTDIMTGSMTVNLPAYGVLKGELHLNRQK